MVEYYQFIGVIYQHPVESIFLIKILLTHFHIDGKTLGPNLPPRLEYLVSPVINTQALCILEIRLITTNKRTVTVSQSC